MRARLTASDASILVHVEGTRARVANAPVQRMSSIWVDLALASDAVMVPVRFTGGLPLVTRVAIAVAVALVVYGVVHVLVKGLPRR